MDGRIAVVAAAVLGGLGAAAARDPTTPPSESHPHICTVLIGPMGHWSSVVVPCSTCCDVDEIRPPDAWSIVHHEPSEASVWFERGGA